MKIPEVTARDILTTYEGANNQLLEWKSRLNEKGFKLTRTQSDYILKYHELKPKVARKYINIVETFAEDIMSQRRMMTPPSNLWVEKILCDTEKAYHIWGKYYEKDKLQPIWIPKIAIVQEEKKLNRIIDYSKYNIRPPFSHQKIAIEKLLANDKFILADDMGLMKTGSSVIASLESGAKKVLIVCPASLKINWKREIEIYTNKKIFIVEGKRWGSTFDYYIINYDILKNYHSTEEGDNESYNLIENTKFDLAIIDEAHFISNSTARRTELLMDILEKIPKVWLLTGTPMTSRPINYYNLLKIVNSPLTLSWKQYVYRYCRGYRITKSDGKKTWITSGSSNLDELRERTKNIVLRRMKTDILDLPEKTISPIFLELNNTFYNDEIEEFLKITKENKEKESITITLNRLMGVRKLIAIEKIPYTCELIDKLIEQDKKVIILTNFTAPIDMLVEKYKKISVVVDGRVTSKEKRQKSVDTFQNDPKIKLFIGNLKAAGIGLNLTAAEAVIMNDLSFVPSDHNQGEDRAYRHGQKKCVNIYYPIFDNTIERIVYNILNKKKNIIDQVLGDGEYSESFSKELLKELV